MPESADFAARVLACVESIPPGKVMTYGDVAEFAGIRSPRSVGRVLAHDGGTVPWHRVLRSNGTLAEHLYDEQRQRLLGEGAPVEGTPEAEGKTIWTPEKVRETLASRKTVQANFPKPLPVYIVYMSSAALQDGSIKDYTDIYKKDKKVLAALNDVVVPKTTPADKPKDKVASR